VNGLGEPQVRNAHAGIAFRFFPSLTDAMFVLPLVFLFFKLNGARTMLGDGDTGWHLRTGEWILANGRVPDRDIFSFTKAGEPWYAWEWLWDVIFGWLHQNWGMAAVVLASSLVLALTFALLFRLVRRACDHEFIAAAVTLVACGASALHWLARPHLFTLLFLVILLSILERVREGRTRLLLWLPPLFVLWTNLHGGFIAGIAVILAYGAGELASWLVEADQEHRRAALARAKPYLVTALAAAAASFVNPYGYKLHVHIWRYLRDPFLYRHISEFLSADFQRADAIYFELLLLAGGLAAWRSLRRREFTPVILYLFWGQAALFAVRNIPVFALIMAPHAAVAVREAIEALAEAPVRERLRQWAAAFLDSSREFAPTGSRAARLRRQPRGIPCAERTHACALAARKVPRRIRPETLPGARHRSTGRGRAGPRRLHARRVGRLSDLPAVPQRQSLRGWPQRFLRLAFRQGVPRRDAGAARLGGAPGQIRRAHRAAAGGCAAGRGHEAVPALARDLRRRRGDRVSPRRRASGEFHCRDGRWNRSRFTGYAIGKSEPTRNPISKEEKHMTLVKNFLRDDSGQDLIEYALLLAFICLFSAAVFISVGQEVSGIWSVAKTATNKAASAASTGQS
jgi:Flp pilus assembly pilin Flp